MVVPGAKWYDSLPVYRNRTEKEQSVGRSVPAPLPRMVVEMVGNPSPSNVA